MLTETAGRGQHFQARGHSFSLYGPTLSRQITCLFIFSCGKLVLLITNGFVYATLVIRVEKGRAVKRAVRSWSNV